MRNMKPTLYLLFFCAAVSLNGCGLFGDDKKPDTSGNIFGRWELQEIRYDNGKVLKPADGEPYWFELSQDSIWAEGANRLSLSGQSNCNSCFGFYDLNEGDHSINLVFICYRYVCGIATEFATSVSTAYTYTFKNNALILTFKYPTQQISPNSGKMILIPKQ